MERFYTKILGTPVLEDDNIRPVTTVKDLVVDPETGKLIAFVVNVSRNMIIAPRDVVSWHDAIHVSNRDVIIHATEIMRVDTVQKNDIILFHARVETKNGKYLGKVMDYSIDMHLYDLKKLFVAKDFLGLFRFDSRIITAKNILEILPDKIVVKDDLATVKQEKEEKVSMEDLAAA